MVTRRPLWMQVDRWLVGLGALAVAGPALAADPVVEEWRTSPFHKMQNAATGQPIPCTCRYREKSYRVGEKVCLSTPAGSHFARCDLSQNVTTWVPINEACTVSLVPPQGADRAFAALR